MKQLKCYPGSLGKTRIISFKTEEEWLNERKKYVTASDVATLFCDEVEAQGETVYQTPYTLGLEKAGMLEREFSNEETGRNWFAHEAEEVAAKYWRTVDPKKPTFRINGFHLILHEDYPYLAATLDLMTVLDTGPAPLEIKAPGEWNSSEWRNGEAPLKFQIQNNIQMLLTGCTHGVIFGLIGGYTPKWTVLERNEDLCSLAASRAEKFMTDIQNGIIPPPDGRTRSTEALKQLHPNDNGEAVNLPEESVEWYRQLEHWESVRKEAERKEEEYKNLVKSVLGEYTYGVHGPIQFSWKSSGGTPTKIEVGLDQIDALANTGIPFKVKESPVVRRLYRKLNKGAQV
jgi:predicted phage-related endonuclease